MISLSKVLKKKAGFEQSSPIIVGTGENSWNRKFEMIHKDTKQYFNTQAAKTDAGHNLQHKSKIVRQPSHPPKQKPQTMPAV